MSELHNPAASRWDLDLLWRKAGIPHPFGNGITCADVDIEIERNHHFLVLEGKRTGQHLSNGQARAIQARLATNRTCFVFWGDPDAGIVEQIGYYVEHFPGSHHMQLETVAGDLAMLADLCAQWYRWADEQPVPDITRTGFEPAFLRSMVPA